MFCSCATHLKQDFSHSNFKYNGIYKIDTINGVEFSFYNEPTKILKIDTVALIKINDFESLQKVKDKGYYGFNLQINLNDSATKVFADYTKNHINKQLAIILNDKLIIAPIIMSEISGGHLSITGTDEKLVDEIVNYYKPKK